MHQFTMVMDAGRDAKNRLVTDVLPPVLRSWQEPYFLVRSVERLPVVHVYVKCSTERAASMAVELQDLLDRFVEGLDDEQRQPAAGYDDLWKDVRRIHRTARARPIFDRTVYARQLEYLDRTGNFTFPEEPELYNRFLFDAQPLMERTSAFLEGDRASREQVFLFCLFYVAAMQLDRTGAGRGYLSFKSHVIGFFSFRHSGLTGYLKAFAEAFDRNRDVYERMAAVLDREFGQGWRAQTGGSGPTAESGLPGELAELISDWDDLLGRLYRAMFEIRRPIRVSPWKALRVNMALQQFQGLSTFHRDAFSAANRAFIQGNEFGAYRMVVNFVYPMLPTLGISSRKRVEAAYCLVRTLDGGDEFIRGRS